jgi:hypothetical protein
VAERFSDGVGTLRHLIVIVPGIGGSVLADASGVVWGDTMRRVVGVVRDPARLSISEAPRLDAVGLMGTLGFCPPFQLRGYDDLVNALVNGLDTPDLVVDVAADGRARNLRADIVQLPYDFRLGVQAASRRLAAEVTARLAHLSESERARRVIVIGHSMGGLVARCWASDPQQAGMCMAVLTVGTPHRGASKALDWLVNGVAIGDRMPVGASAVKGASRVLLNGTTAMLREWPGMYDLLPTYQVVEDLAGGRRLNAVDLAGPTGPGFAADTVFVREAGRAADLQAMITNAWSAPKEDRPVTIPFFARDHGTAHGARLTDGTTLTVSNTDPEWQPNPGWRGDGTVPAISAIPPEMGGPVDASRLHHVSDRHLPMASTGAVVQMVRSLVGDDVSAVRGTPLADVRLGVDLDDAAVVGEPVTVAARLLSGAATLDPTGVTVWVTVQPEDHSTKPTHYRGDPDGTGWQVSFTPPASGLWQVRVEATTLEVEPAAVTDTLAVLDPHDPDLL